MAPVCGPVCMVVTVFSHQLPLLFEHPRKYATVEKKIRKNKQYNETTIFQLGFRLPISSNVNALSLCLLLFNTDRLMYAPFYIWCIPTRPRFKFPVSTQSWSNLNRTNIESILNASLFSCLFFPNVLPWNPIKICTKKKVTPNTLKDEQRRRRNSFGENLTSISLKSM